MQSFHRLPADTQQPEAFGSLKKHEFVMSDISVKYFTVIGENIFAWSMATNESINKQHVRAKPLPKCGGQVEPGQEIRNFKT